MAPEALASVQFVTHGLVSYVGGYLVGMWSLCKNTQNIRVGATRMIENGNSLIIPINKSTTTFQSVQIAFTIELHENLHRDGKESTVNTRIAQK